MGYHVKCSLCGYVHKLSKKEYMENITKTSDLVGHIICNNCNLISVVKKEHLISDEESEW